MTWKEIQENLPKYETEVMQIGAWRSYVELEETLSLGELMELYVGVVESKIEEFKNMARANGAKIDDKEGEGDPEAFNKVMDQVREKQGIKKEEKRNNKVGLFAIKNV